MQYRLHGLEGRHRVPFATSGGIISTTSPENNHEDPTSLDKSSARNPDAGSGDTRETESPDLIYGRHTVITILNSDRQIKYLDSFLVYLT